MEAHVYSPRRPVAGPIVLAGCGIGPKAITIVQNNNVTAPLSPCIPDGNATYPLFPRTSTFDARALPASLSHSHLLLPTVLGSGDTQIGTSKTVDDIFNGTRPDAPAPMLARSALSLVSHRQPLYLQPF